MKALEKDRTRRYGSAVGSGGRHAAPPRRRAGPGRPAERDVPGRQVRPAAPRWRRRRGGARPAAGGVRGVMAVQARRIARERDRANREASDRHAGVGLPRRPLQGVRPERGAGQHADGARDSRQGARQLREPADQPDVQARLQATIGPCTPISVWYDRRPGPLLQQPSTRSGRLSRQPRPETLPTAHQLANLHWYRGEACGGRTALRRSSSGGAAMLGDDHPDTLGPLRSGQVYALQKRWTEAERLSRRTLAIQQRALGPSTPTRSLTMGDPPIHVLQPGALRGSGTDSRHDTGALDVGCAGLTHPDTLVDLHNLATIHDRMGRYSLG